MMSGLSVGKMCAIVNMFLIMRATKGYSVNQKVGNILLMRVIMIAAVLVFLSSVSLYAATIQLPRTGQSTCIDTNGAVIACTNTGQDGDKLAGVPWPNPRFTDNGNGTVTDNLTGLIWLKKASCTDTVGGIAGNIMIIWPNALTWSNKLTSGKCGLSDGSVVGDWRLPNIVELNSLVDVSRSRPALPNGHPFGNVLPGWYWSSVSDTIFHDAAWLVSMDDGGFFFRSKNLPYGCVWPVRGGQ